jgi:hypothetical protein
MRPTGAKPIFIEVTNELNGMDPSILAARVKSMPDYANFDQNKAEKDYLHRLEVYSQYFERIDEGANSSAESLWSYFKCDHLRQHFVVNKISGEV